MGKPVEPESYEVTEYAKNKELRDKFSVISQIVQDKIRENPTYCCRVFFVGDMLKLVFCCYEMNLPARMKEIEKLAHDCMNEMVRVIKKEFKSHSKMSLDLKEDKKKANYSVQKVSLNERYYYMAWRFYEISE